METSLTQMGNYHTFYHLSESHFKNFCTFAVKELQKAVSPDPAAVDPKPEEAKEPKEAPPAPSESTAPDTSGPILDGVAPEGEKHTDIFNYAFAFNYTFKMIEFD